MKSINDLTLRQVCLLAGIVIAGMATAWAVDQFHDRQAALDRDRHVVMKITQKMKTACVGRFLIDLPEDAQIELVRPRIDGFEIASFEESYSDFQNRMSDREEQLKAIPDRHGGNRNLESVSEVKTSNGLVGKIFVHGRTVSEGTQANGLELERYRYEGIAVEALVHGEGISIDLAAENYDPERMGALPQLVAQLVSNPGNQPPIESTFCIRQAYFHDPLSADQGESITMVARLPSNPDIEFMLLLLAGTVPDEKGLLQRTSDAFGRLSDIEEMRVSTLRSNQRTIGALDGEEVAERVVEDNNAVVFSFWWEVNGTSDNVMAPHLALSMETGRSDTGPVPSSLSETAATELWDKISSSVRTRLPQS